MQRKGHHLRSFVEHSTGLHGIRRADVHAGDLLLVMTRNSSYLIRVLDEKTCCVSGGWFDRKGLSPMKTSVAGCSWGTTLLNTEMVAAPGMSVEFGNRVVTSTIQTLWIFRHGTLN